jgi:hypothetical protein
MNYQNIPHLISQIFKLIFKHYINSELFHHNIHIYTIKVLHNFKLNDNLL